MSLSEAAGLIGAITGPIGLVVAVLAFLRDRSRLWVSININMRVQNHSSYDPSVLHFVVTAANIGRRPEYISSVIVLFPDGQNCTMSDTFFNPNEVNEGGPPRKFLAKQSTVEELNEQWPGVKVVVRTASGRQYRSRFLREQPKFGKDFRFVDKLRLRVQVIFKHRWAFRRRFLE